MRVCIQNILPFPPHITNLRLMLEKFFFFAASSLMRAHLASAHLGDFMPSLKICAASYQCTPSYPCSYSLSLCRTTLYSSKMNAWYDMKTKEELLNSTIFSLIQRSLDTPGLVGLDKLMSFMIVRELQVKCVASILYFI